MDRLATGGSENLGAKQKGRGKAARPETMNEGIN